MISIFSVFFLYSASVVSAGTIRGTIETNGIVKSSSAIVYIKGVKGTFATPGKRPQMDHVNQKFVPTMLPVLKGSTVDFPNSDNVFHSAFSISESNSFDLGIYGPGKEKFVTFKNQGIVEIFCHIHDHMFGYVLVLDNPYFSIADEKGAYSIDNIPPGTYDIVGWVNPRLNITQKVTIKGNEFVALNLKVKKP